MSLQSDIVPASWSTRKRLIFISLVFVFLFGQLGYLGCQSAKASDFVPSEAVRLRLISSQTEISGSTEKILVGLDIKLSPKWKFYWRSPGQYGIPPQFDWIKSENFNSAEVFWPAPERIIVSTSPPEFFLGYSESVILPIGVQLARPGSAVKLRLKLDYGICSDFCFPVTDFLELNLPKDRVGSSRNSQRIGEYMERVPRENGSYGIRIISAGVLPNGRGIMIHACSENSFSEPDVFVESSSSLPFSIPQVLSNDDRKLATFTVEYIRDSDQITSFKSLAPKDSILVTIADGRKAVESKLTLSRASKKIDHGERCVAP